MKRYKQNAFRGLNYFQKALETCVNSETSHDLLMLTEPEFVNPKRFKKLPSIATSECFTAPVGKLGSDSKEESKAKLPALPESISNLPPLL